MIADIRDTIQHWLVDRYKMVDELEFYPWVWQVLEIAWHHAHDSKWPPSGVFILKYKLNLEIQ